MSEHADLTPDELFKITKKKRAHAQWRWFKNAFGVDLPCNGESVVISRWLYEQLQARRAGLITEAPKAERPQIYSLRTA